MSSGLVSLATGADASGLTVSFLQCEPPLYVPIKHILHGADVAFDRSWIDLRHEVHPQ